MQRFEYDALGRRTKEIKNYGDGTPSGTDSDVTIRYEYANGLRTKYIADLPSGQTDQETLYIYGTTKGSPRSRRSRQAICCGRRSTPTRRTAERRTPTSTATRVTSSATPTTRRDRRSSRGSGRERHRDPLRHARARDQSEGLDARFGVRWRGASDRHCVRQPESHGHRHPVRRGELGQRRGRGQVQLRLLGQPVEVRQGQQLHCRRRRRRLRDQLHLGEGDERPQHGAARTVTLPSGNVLTYDYSDASGPPR